QKAFLTRIPNHEGYQIREISRAAQLRGTGRPAGHRRVAESARREPGELRDPHDGAFGSDLSAPLAHDHACRAPDWLALADTLSTDAGTLRLFPYDRAFRPLLRARPGSECEEYSLGNVRSPVSDSRCGGPGDYAPARRDIDQRNDQAARLHTLETAAPA